MLIDIHTHRPHNAISVKEVLVFDAADSDGRWKQPHLRGENGLISLGVHPWSASLWNMDGFTCLKSDVVDPRVLMMGEIGLDKSSSVPFSTQKIVFKAQLEMAELANKPVILHIVRAMAEILELKKSHPGIPAWIIHGFRGGKQEAEQYIKKEFYLSFGTKFNPAALNACPMDKMFLETDESEEGIELIYDRVADTLRCTVETLEEQIEANFRSIFRK